jgi:hypothetical protein
MTSITGRRGTLEFIINMASGTGYTGMGSRQFKKRKIMIKSSRFPGLRSMATNAVWTEPASMFIILLVTGSTTGWSACQHIVNMTFFAYNIDMCTSQVKRREVMVKRCRFPGLGGMAGTTILT